MTAPGPPAVSVIVPAFNAEPFIAETLRSVQAQRFQDFEIVVVDDCSSDATAAQVEQMRAADPRIRLIRMPQNSGRPAVARNAGVAAAGGEFVAFLDADDLWLPWKLSDQVAVMTRQPDLVFVYSMVQSFGGGLRRGDVAYGVKPLPFRVALTRAQLERENVIACSSVLARRAAVVAAGGFDEDPQLAAVEDYDLWLRLSATGRVAVIPRIHARYRTAAGISARTNMARRLHYLMAKQGIDATAVVERNRGGLGLAVRAIVHDLVLALTRVGEVVTRGLAPHSVPVIGA